jgi:hypothetical protein
MLMTRIRCWLVGLTAVLVTSTATAQHYQPFIEPSYFGHDLQYFAPVSDLDTYGDDPIMRYGWFGSYNRMYIGMSRPDHAVRDGQVVTVDTPAEDMLDMTWGNRWDIGYMIDDVNHDHGWSFSYMHIDGPNLGEVVRQQRLNRLNEDDEGFPEPDDGQGGGTQTDSVEPVSDRNDLGPDQRERFYDVTDSLNMAKVNSLELNKIFRVPPLYHGGIFEPFFGVRYIKFEDEYVDQDYEVYDPDGLSPIWTPLPPSSLPIEYGDAEIEQIFTDRFRFTNQLIGGQLGFRVSRRTSRWNLSGEVRGMAFQNFQHLHRAYNVTRTYYDGAGAGSEVDAIIKSRTTEDWNTTETVVGADIRATAAFDVTRDFSLEFGFQYIGMYTGIGRGRNINYNSEDVNMIGTTFGFVVRK